METAFAIAAALTAPGSFALQSGPDGDAIAAPGAAMLSTGVEMPDGGICGDRPCWN